MIFIYLAVGMLTLVMADELLSGGNIDYQETPPLHLRVKTPSDSQLPVINDLTNGEVMLQWTAPGDDGYSGRAAGYDIRYRPARFGPIDSEYEWLYANQITGEAAPSQAGHIDSMLVIGLESGEGYYFCIKAFDEAGNYSSLSNSPLVTASNMGYTINININGWGTVSRQPDQTCYQSGETITLTAMPTSYWEFINWSGDIESTVNPTSFIILSDMFITATFTTDFIPGDANGDGNLLSSDITYLISYFRGQQPAPNPFLAGDANGDCDITGSDLTYIVYYFRGIGPLPIRGDCDNIFISTDENKTTR